MVLYTSYLNTISIIQMKINDSYTIYRMKKERERIAQEVDSQTQTSSPGGTDGRGGSGWGGKLSALLHVHRGSRASSRKSSRASDASDLSELGTASAWLFPNLPLLLLSGATGTHEDLQPPALTVSRPSPTTEQLSATSSSGSDSHATFRLVHSTSSSYISVSQRYDNFRIPRLRPAMSMCTLWS